MVVSVDKIINPFSAQDGGAHLPPEAPLAMPVQSLEAWPHSRPLPAGRQSVAVTLARIFVFSETIALTGLGTYEIYQVISPADITWLQVLFAALFAITFAWISFSCVSAILGFICRRRYRIPPLAPLDAIGRTALLMPVYNEDPVTVSIVLERMARALAAARAHEHFDIFVLSDTRDARHPPQGRAALRPPAPAARSASCRSTTAGGPTTITRRPATSPTSSRAGAAPTTT